LRCRDLHRCCPRCPVAALPTDRFFFEGLLPAKETARRARLAELKRIDATLVMFESGNRVQDTLRDLADYGPRDARDLPRND